MTGGAMLSLAAGMGDFLEAVAARPFMQYALLTGVLASVACGVVGTYVVIRRITYIAGAISHCALGGIGAAMYLQRGAGWSWLDPMYGAVIAALMAAGIIGWVSLRGRQREDTVIGAVWAVGMAIGILCLQQTPGYNEDLMSYLFGNILMVSPGDLWLMGVLDVAVVALGLAFYKQFLAVCFEEEFARARGLRVDLYYMLLLIMTALTVVLLVTVVGVILVIALLTLPVALAGRFARTMWHMMVLSGLVTVAVTTGGLAVGYTTNFPPGATIIILAAALYLVAAGVGEARARLRKRWRGKTSQDA